MRGRILKVIACLMTVVMVLSIAPLGGLADVELFSTTASAIDSRVENAVQRAIAIANDNSHGYSQSRRTGPDYDCSSLVYYAFSSAGFSLSPAWFNTRNMGDALKNAGFTELTNINLSNSNALQRGDILWKSGHTEIYIGSNQLVGAHSDYGSPQTGDQSGKEISVGRYYYKGNNGTTWTKVYRYGSSQGGYGEITVPVISTYKNYYHVGETAQITWTPSSSHTDFYQYWLVIRNKSINKTMFEGASGNNGDVNANSYNYKVPQKGEYTVTVYAVPYNNKGVRQREYTKTLYVDTESKTISDDEYHIISALGTDMTLDVSGTSKDNGANIQIWHNLWNPEQTFNIKHISNGCYTIIFKYSGKALDVGGGSTNIGANVQQYTYGGAPQQQWIIKPTSDGKWYNIVSVHTGYYLTVANNSAANGTNVEMRPANGSNSQKWKFSSASHIHSYSVRTTKNPTCVNNGIRTYTCSCGNSYTQSIPALGHSYNSYYTVDIPATCTHEGSQSFHCSRCNSTTGSVTIAKTEHTYSDWVATQQATETQAGVKVRQCTACGKYESRIIEKLKSTTTPISKCTFSTLKPVVYTGKAITPTVTVKNGKTTLKAGTHYTVSYKNNTKVGKATVTIKGVEKNGYTGTKTLTFNILPGVTKSIKATQSTSAIKLTWSKVAGATGYRVYRHNGKKWVKLADTKNTTYTVSKLKAGTNYKYAVKAYTTVGKAVYWSDSFAQLSTTTKPATPTIKIATGKKQATVSWNKITGATGYVVYYSTSKNGTYKKLATVKGASYTAKKLTTGKTYYFKVAAYKTVGKANIYSSYSSVKSVKVK